MATITKTEKTVNGQIVLLVDSGEFTGCEFYYGGISFGEAENPDGTMNLIFETTIVNDFTVSDGGRFNKFAGDFLLTLLEEEIDKREVIYKGGT